MSRLRGSARLIAAGSVTHFDLKSNRHDVDRASSLVMPPMLEL